MCRTSVPFLRRTMCNAYNHADDCDCGFGGDTGGGGWSYVRESWQYRDDDSSHPTTCPLCGAAVFFVRHNGGSVWFEELGPPWDKHGCFADEPCGRALRQSLQRIVSGGVAPVFGVVAEIRRPPGSDAGFVAVRCSDGDLLDRWVPNARIPPGQLVVVRRNGDAIILEVIGDAVTQSEWICKNCFHSNESRAVECRSCQQPRAQGL
jgi:hypothetical protein